MQAELMHDLSTQHEILTPSSLLDAQGRLTQVGWARAPLLDCNLEQVAFYPRPLRLLQRLRVKRWDYYGVTTPERYFSVTLADLGYAGQAFVYTVDFATGRCHEETLTIPPGGGIRPAAQQHGRRKPLRQRQGAPGLSGDAGRPPHRRDLAGFRREPLSAEISFATAPEHESTVVVIPIRGNRFYYNRKINCLPARAGCRSATSAPRSRGNLPGQPGLGPRRLGISLLLGVGQRVGLPGGRADARPQPGLRLWRHRRGHREHGDPERPRPQAGAGRLQLQRAEFHAALAHGCPDGRLDLTFTPFVERVAATNLLLIASTVHQLFGRYSGHVVADDGERIAVDGLVGFAEEHHARW
jgi:hypothetical protein